MKDEMNMNQETQNVKSEPVKTNKVSSAASANRAKIAARNAAVAAGKAPAQETLLRQPSKKSKKKKKNGKGFNLRRFQYGSISVAIVIMFIAAIVMLNVGMQYLTDRYYLKWDITPTNYYEISDTSRNLLDNMTEDVTAYILLSEDSVINSTYYKIAYEFLQRYRSLANGHLEIEFVDIYKNPSFINKYQDSTDEITAGSFIIQSDLRYKVLKLADLYTVNTVQTSDEYDYTQYISGVDADQNLISAIQYVTAKDLPTVVFVTGHNENYGKNYAKLFTNNNYYYEECNLVLNDIPSDAEVVILGQPMFDYTEEETERLDRYITQESGTVIMFAGVSVNETPVIDGWLEEWGIGLTNNMVLDSERSLGDASGIVADIVATEVCPDLDITDSTYLLMSDAVEVKLLYDTKENHTNKAILTSSKSSYSKELTNGKNITTYGKESGDAEGPFDVGVLSRFSGTVNGKPVYGTLCVLGSGEMINDTYLDMQTLANRQYLLGLMQYLYTGINTFVIEEANYTSSAMVVLESQANVVFWLLIVIIPAAILVLGIYVWLKRRHQ